MTPQNHLLPNRIYRFLAVNLMLLGLSVPLLKAQVQFSSPKNYPVGTKPVAAAVADFNGDGKQDLVVVNSGSGDVSILLAKGDGTFEAAVNYSVGGTSSSPISPTFVAVGDFNGDGKLDLAVANGTANTVSILLGNGDGTFQAPEQFPAGTSASYIAVGDFNGDGKPDLLAFSNQTNSISILLGNGDGTFQSPLTTPLPRFQTHNFTLTSSAAVGDFDRDGRLDVALAGSGGQSLDTGVFGNVIILFGKGDGTFQPAQAFAFGSDQLVFPNSFAVGDFNGDGKLDLAIATAFGIGVLLGKSDGTFGLAPGGGNQIPRYSDVPGSFCCVAAADVNDEGKLDLIGLAFTFSSETWDIQVLLGNGDGTFQGTNSLQLTYVPTWLAVGDFNRDKLPDLVVTNSNLVNTTTQGNNISVFLNITPHFSLSSSPTSATVTAGGSATFTLSVTPENAFNQTVTLSCAGAPSEATCSISPESVTPDGTAAASATLTLTTTARSSAPPLPWAKPDIPGKQWIPVWIAFGGGLILLATVAPASRRNTRWLRPLRGLALAATLLVVALWAACGGASPTTGGSNGGTPAGTYTLTIEATAGSLTHTASVKVTVN